MRQRLKPMSQINVVPYIDVMLVLLVIFMVTAPLIQTASVNLPSVSQTAQPPVAPLEVIIHADQSLGLIDRSTGKAQETPVKHEDLAAAIRASLARHSGQAVLIAGDKAVRYEAVLAVMDELQKLKAGRIGLLVEPQQP